VIKPFIEINVMVLTILTPLKLQVLYTWKYIQYQHLTCIVGKQALLAPVPGHPPLTSQQIMILKVLLRWKRNQDDTFTVLSSSHCFFKYLSECNNT